MITVGTLKHICPNTPMLTLEPFVDPLNAVFVEFAIDTVERQQRFLAQVAHESQGFTRLEENLHYTAKGLAQTWPLLYAVDRHAPHDELAPNALAVDLAHKGPEAIANNAYANRMGNGPDASGDGWRYRGAGLIETTGAVNQAVVADFFMIPLEDVGAWLRTPEGAARSAGLFWDMHGLNNVEDFTQLTHKINGGDEGVASRYAYLGRAKEAVV